MTDTADDGAAGRSAEAVARSQRPPRPPERPPAPIVPPANVSGSALMLVIAIMSFLACLTLGAVIMVQDTAATWQSQVAREVTIQILPEDGLDMAVALERAARTVAPLSGVANVEIMGDDATRRLLEPWLGDDLRLDELPVPRLIVVTIDDSRAPDFDAMRLALAEAVPEATLDDHRAWVDRLVAMARTTVVIGLSILSLVFTATILTVIFATRGALSGNTDIVEVLHFVGAEARFVAGEFQRHFLMIGLKGAAAGGLLAALVFAAAGIWQRAFLASPESDQAAALFGRVSIGFGGFFGILAIVAVIALMTALTTRFTVIRTIHQIDRARADPGRLAQG